MTPSLFLITEALFLTRKRQSLHFIRKKIHRIIDNDVVPFTTNFQLYDELTYCLPYCFHCTEAKKSIFVDISLLIIAALSVDSYDYERCRRFIYSAFLDPT